MAPAERARTDEAAQVRSAVGTARRARPERAAAAGVPEGPAFGQLQRGKPVTLPDGRTVRPEEVVDPAAR